MTDPVEFRKRVSIVLDEWQGREKPEEPHEKFLRALLHVVAGIIAALTIIVASSIQSIGSSTATTGPLAKLYILIFSEMTVYLSVVLLLATATAFVVQIFRLLIKIFNKKWLFSSSAVVLVILGVLFPSVVTTNIAVCGAAAFSTPSANWNAEGAKEEIAELLPGWLPARCDRNVERWFKNAGTP